MGSFAAGIDGDLEQWIRKQPLFFVATAPLSSGGHVNLSPKGIDSLAVLGPNRVAYGDLTGSGAETIAHLRENGRITIMMSAFAGPPKIARLYGHGVAHLPDSSEFELLVDNFPERGDALRSIIDVSVSRVQISCGFGVPEMDFVGHRTRLLEWAEAQPSLEDYRARKNERSIDGLPSLDPR